jgi:hypothetical protein
MKHVKTFAGLLLVVGTSVSCGNVVRQGRSPVYLVIDKLEGVRGAKTLGTPSGFLTSDVLTLVTSPDPCKPESPCPTVFDDSGLVTLRVSPKDITNPAGPSTNNDVTITHYRINYKRTDGRNTQGVDVPYGFDAGLSGTIPAGGSAGLSFELVRHTSKEESPLVELVAGPSIISSVAEITFYGRDQAGNDLSVTGSIQVNFGNFGDF